MTAPRKPTFEEVLASCRPVPPAKPNILQVLLAVQEAVGYVPTKHVPRIAQVLGVSVDYLLGETDTWTRTELSPIAEDLVPA